MSEFALSSPLPYRRAADISACGRFRYSLTRDWTPRGETPRWAAFCGLNPSTADALVDDPTIRRDVSFARAMGATALIKVNVIPWRATDPKALRAVVGDWTAERVRRENDRVLRHAADLGRRGVGVVAAWGALPTWLRGEVDRALDALGLPLLCLGTTKDGSPRHPLYLPRTAPLVEWRRKVDRP